MASYEGVRETRETVAQTNVLTDAMRRGDFSGVAGATIRDPLTGLQFPNNIIPADRIDPLAVSMVNQYQPLPNQSGANNFRGLTRAEDTQNQYITRIDHVINAKQKIFGHYLYQGRDNPSFPINPEFPVARLFNNHSLAVQHVTTWSSNLLNEIRFGYMRGDLNRLSPRRTTGFSVEEDLGIHGMLVGGPNGRPPNEDEIGFPTITIQGFNGFGDGTGGEGIDKSQTYQFVNNTTLIRGRHALKMGADIRRLFGDATSTNAPFGALDFTRDITGHAAAAFIMGFPRTSRTPEGIPIGGIRQWRTGFYLQDDWRVTPRATINLGLRYDKNLPPKDINGVSRTLRFDLDPKGPVLWPEAGEVVDELYFNKQRGWAPRLGFAYQMTDRLVFRGGYGIFNMALHLDNINTLGTNPPTASVQVTNPTTNPIATIAYPFPAVARSHEPDLQRHVGRGRSEPRGRLLPELERGRRLRALPRGGRRSALRRREGQQSGHEPDELQQPRSRPERRLDSAAVAPSVSGVRADPHVGDRRGERLSLAAERVQAPRAVGIEPDRRVYALQAERQPAGRSERLSRPPAEPAQPRGRVRALGRRPATSPRHWLRVGHPIRVEPDRVHRRAPQGLAVERPGDLQLRLPASSSIRTATR